MTLPLNSKINRAFKYAVGAGATTDDREAYQEERYLRRDICGRDIKADAIVIDPHNAIGTVHDDNDGIVYCVRAALSPLTPDGRVWYYANYPDLPWVHPRYDTPFNSGWNPRTLITSQYQVQIFQDDEDDEGAPIPPQASPNGVPGEGWVFDYDTGLLYFSAPPTQLKWPIHIFGYQYSGSYGGGESIQSGGAPRGSVVCLRTDSYAPLGSVADILNPLCREVIGVCTGDAGPGKLAFKSSGVVYIAHDGGLSAGEPAYLGTVDYTGYNRLARGTGPVLKSLGTYLGGNQLLLNIGPTIIL